MKFHASCTHDTRYGQTFALQFRLSCGIAPRISRKLKAGCRWGVHINVFLRDLRRCMPHRQFCQSCDHWQHAGDRTAAERNTKRRRQLTDILRVVSLWHPSLLSEACTLLSCRSAIAYIKDLAAADRQTAWLRGWIWILSLKTFWK